MNLKRSTRVALARIDKTQAWLAQASGISKPTISVMCSTNRTSSNSLAAIAEALGMTVSEFVAIGEE
jgi:hypothetical protein